MARRWPSIGWAPTAGCSLLMKVLLVVLAASHTVCGGGVMCPYQGEVCAHKPDPPLTSCLWYGDRACCDHRETNDIIRWFYTTKRHQPESSAECLSLLHIMRCGLVCSPAQAEFVEDITTVSVGKKQSVDKKSALYNFTLCSSFCDRLYAACSGANASASALAKSTPPSSWEAALMWDEEGKTSSDDFCRSLAPPGVKINVVDESRSKARGHAHQCYNGRTRVASAATSFVYGSGLAADFAGHWSFMIQARDYLGEELHDGGDHFEVEIENLHDPQTEVPVEVTDMANGLYTVSFVLRQAGRYRFSILLEGQHLSNSPTFTTLVDHNQCLNAKSLRKAEKPARRLNRCSWYNDKACCTVEKDQSIDRWLKSAIAPLFKNQSRCFALFEELWCGFECSSHRAIFLDPYDSESDEQNARICTAFCKSLYQACRDVPLMGLSLGSVYSRYQDFCAANVPEGFIRVKVTDTNCFNGSRAELSPHQSFVYRPKGKPYGVAGEQLVVHIQAVDVHGEWMAYGGEQFTVHIDGPYVDKSKVIDHSNGTYSVFYRASRADEYKLAIYHQGVELAHSPLTLNVIAGPTDPLASIAHGPGLYRALAGFPATFSIEARDEFGNVRSDGKDNVFAQISGPRSVTAEVSYTGMGLYLVQYTVDVAGQYMMRVTVNGFQITGSPFFVTVEADDKTHAPSCTVEEVSEATVGQIITFKIIAKDKYGNPREEGGNEFQALFETPLREEYGEVTDEGDGTYTVTYRPTSAGQYLIQVLMLETDAEEETWVPVTDSPLELMVGAVSHGKVATVAAAATFVPRRRNLDRWSD